jgi:hypothetical protein
MFLMYQRSLMCQRFLIMEIGEWRTRKKRLFINY